MWRRVAGLHQGSLISLSRPYEDCSVGRGKVGRIGEATVTARWKLTMNVEKNETRSQAEADSPCRTVDGNQVRLIVSFLGLPQRRATGTAFN